MRLNFELIDSLWENSRRSGVLAELYRERIDDWRLLKCARAYARLRGSINNAKLVRLLERIRAWLRIRVSEVRRHAHVMLKSLSQRGKFGIGTWGSAGLRDRLLSFYLDLKNASAPADLLIDLYS